MTELKKPVVGEHVYLAPGAIVRGDVTLQEEVSVWFHAVIRAEEGSITIGRGSNIQDGCVVHVDKGGTVRVGEQVTVGHNAVVHGCSVGDNTLIGMGAIIMNDAVIGKDCIVAAGALVTERTVIPDNSLVMGSPARVKRALTPEEIRSNSFNARHYVEEAAMYAEYDKRNGDGQP